MSKIIINREKSFIACAAPFDIFLDNKYVGKVYNGGELTLVVNDGNHQLYVKNGLLSFGTKSNVLFFDTNSSLVNIFIKFNLFSLSGIKVDLVSITNNYVDDANNKYNELQRLYNLKERNVLSEEEYDKQKNRLLKGE